MQPHRPSSGLKVDFYNKKLLPYYVEGGSCLKGVKLHSDEFRQIIREFRIFELEAQQEGVETQIWKKAKGKQARAVESDSEHEDTIESRFKTERQKVESKRYRNKAGQTYESLASELLRHFKENVYNEAFMGHISTCLEEHKRFEDEKKEELEKLDEKKKREIDRLKTKYDVFCEEDTENTREPGDDEQDWSEDEAFFEMARKKGLPVNAGSRGTKRSSDQMMSGASPEPVLTSLGLGSAVPPLTVPNFNVAGGTAGAVSILQQQVLNQKVKMEQEALAFRQQQEHQQQLLEQALKLEQEQNMQQHIMAQQAAQKQFMLSRWVLGF